MHRNRDLGTKNGFRPLHNAGVYCHSVRVSVIVKTCNTQRIPYLLWSEFLIITQTRFWKKLRVKLIYPNYCAVHLFSRTNISHRQIQILRSVKNGIAPLFHIYIFSIPKSKFQHVLGKMVLHPNRLHIRL